MSGALENTMKTSSTTLFHNHSHGKRDQRCMNMGMGMPFVLTSISMASIFCFFFLFSPNPLTLVPDQDRDVFENHPQQKEQQHVMTMIPKPSSPKPHKVQKSCDLFKGHWVPSLGGSSSYYTNSSCTTIPESKNCFKEGRKDSDFLNWKWKPEQCELPRFDPRTFLHMVRGKKMAFIGDSVATNHMDSLLCILSQEEAPKDIYKGSEEKFQKWYFPNHDFTIMLLWSRFLIVGEERMVNGTGSSTFDLQIDKVDDDWAKELPELDYAIISDGHWFFRVMYLHEASKLVGCVFCNQPNITDYGVDSIFRIAFRTAFKYINDCKECKKTVTLMRTFAPAHFENGFWDTGGYCNRTGPVSEGEVDFGSFDWKARNIQMEEFERAKSEGRKNGKRFEVVDVTKAMLMRPDGHPGEHWGNKWMRGYNDCTHWCLPGPVDLWSELLFAVLQREAGMSSELEAQT